MCRFLCGNQCTCDGKTLYCLIMLQRTRGISVNYLVIIYWKLFDMKDGRIFIYLICRAWLYMNIGWYCERHLTIRPLSGWWEDMTYSSSLVSCVMTDRDEHESDIEAIIKYANGSIARVIFQSDNVIWSEKLLLNSPTGSVRDSPQNCGGFDVLGSLNCTISPYRMNSWFLKTVSCPCVIG